MTKKLEEKAAAVMALAMGQTKAATARHAGVAPGTVTRWLTEPEFLAEVERMRPVATARPVNARALLAAQDEARDRLRGYAVKGNTVTSYVSIPADATPAKRRRILARAYAKAIVAGMEARE